MPRLVHPDTGGEFDAPDRSVETWARSGWVVKGQPAPRPAGSTKSAAGAPAGGSNDQEK